MSHLRLNMRYVRANRYQSSGPLEGNLLSIFKIPLSRDLSENKRGREEERANYPWQYKAGLLGVRIRSTTWQMGWASQGVGMRSWNHDVGRNYSRWILTPAGTPKEPKIGRNWFAVWFTNTNYRLGKLSIQRFNPDLRCSKEAKAIRGLEKHKPLVAQDNGDIT